jgi:hypothetical protein
MVPIPEVSVPANLFSAGISVSEGDYVSAGGSVIRAASAGLPIAETKIPLKALEGFYLIYEDGKSKAETGHPDWGSERTRS